jgi:hypothetical protein
MQLQKSFVLVLLACSACASGSGATGPYLAPGPLPAIGAPRSPGRDAVPAVPPEVARGTSGAPAAIRAAERSDLPVGLVASGGLGRLPGARLAGVGPVHGLVVSVSLDGKSPSRDERRMVAEVLGGGGGDTGATIARALEAASGGKFRLTFSALPALVDSRGSEQMTDAARIRALASASLRSWIRQLDVSSFDDDGSDGIAGSADDDGVVDLFVMAVEADAAVSSVTVREGVEVPSAGGARKQLGSGPIHVLGLPRDGGDPLIAGIGLVLDAAGLDGGERFFPAGFPRIISSLARVRLGWVATRVMDGAPERSAVAPGEAVLIPLRDVAQGGGFWLVENDGRSTYVTRAVRTVGDHFSPTETKVWDPGQPLVMPLTRQMGALGARAVLTGGPSAPEIQFEGLEAARSRSGDPVSVSPVRW